MWFLNRSDAQVVVRAGVGVNNYTGDVSIVADTGAVLTLTASWTYGDAGITNALGTLLFYSTYGIDHIRCCV